MYRNDKSPRPRRAGFTLVELLAVVVIIGIMASLTTVATSTAMRNAREAKTRGTISKLDAAIQDIFEGYEEKLDNLNIVCQDGVHRSLPDAAKYLLHGDSNPTTNAASEEEIAKMRLHLIRDLMRMEIPINKDEIDTGPLKLTSTGTVSVAAPHVRKCYQDAIGNREPSNAELLFLIVMNLNPEALEQFHESEIVDSDGNGLFEFVDAWGTPIRFLRWAPAFTGTDRQPDVIARSSVGLTSGDNKTLWNEQSVENEKKKASEDYHDPFDRYVDASGDGESSTGATDSWFLYPVAFSAGPDKKFDIFMGPPSYSDSYTWGTILEPFGDPLGIPQDADNDGGNGNGVLNHYDNIHTHRISGGF